MRGISISLHLLTLLCLPTFLAFASRLPVDLDRRQAGGDDQRTNIPTLDIPDDPLPPGSSISQSQSSSNRTLHITLRESEAGNNFYYDIAMEVRIPARNDDKLSPSLGTVNYRDVPLGGPYYVLFRYDTETHQLPECGIIVVFAYNNFYVQRRNSTLVKLEQLRPQTVMVNFKYDSSKVNTGPRSGYSEAVCSQIGPGEWKQWQAVPQIGLSSD